MLASRLVCTAASSTKADSPKPSAVTSAPVAAPGRWRLASAARSSGSAGRGTRAASMRIARPSSARSPSRTTAPARNDRGEHWLRCAGESQHERFRPGRARLAMPPPARHRRAARPARASAPSPGNLRARASGGAAKTSATSSPKAAARTSAQGAISTPARTGSRSPSALASSGVTSTPAASPPSAAPISAAAPICRA